MSASEVIPFTDFIQRPTAAVSRLARVRALHLRRRDAEDLVVMSAHTAEQESDIIELTARLLVSLLRHDDGHDLIRRALPDVLPWMRFLPSDDADLLATEYAEIAEASASVDNTAPISQLLTEWQHTAEVHADAELHALLSAPRGEDHGPALPPAVAE
jgi:hypothetical protein